MAGFRRDGHIYIIITYCMVTMMQKVEGMYIPFAGIFGEGEIW